MSGLLLQGNLAVADTTIPLLRDDKILTAGSLLLLDPLHSARAWPAGVPAPGASAVIPNIAWRESLAAGVGAVQADTDPSLTVGASLSGTVGKMERTTKGAVHGIFSATLADGSAAKSAKIAFVAALKAYLFANLGHSFYISTWTRQTRPNVAGNQDTDFGIAQGSFTGQYLLLGCGNTDRPTVTPPLLGGRAPAYPVPVGPLFRNRAASAWFGTAPANVAAILAAFMFGGTPENANAAGANASGYGSKVFMRGYLEDLTLSGRTYDRVDAIDFGLYTAAVTTAAGKFYGDTFTDPTTIA